MTGMEWARGAGGAVEVISERDHHGNPLRTVPCAEELARFYSEEYRSAYKAAERPRRHWRHEWRKR